MPKNSCTIVVSAISSEDVIKKAFDMGAKYYMVKPYQNDVLYRRIWDVLSLRGATQTAGIVIKGEGKPGTARCRPVFKNRRTAASQRIPVFEGSREDDCGRQDDYIQYYKTPVS